MPGGWPVPSPWQAEEWREGGTRAPPWVNQKYKHLVGGGGKSQQKVQPQVAPFHGQLFGI
eukprot:scaffold206954_cov28-Tisochrysis_lutea.AAC.2